MGAFIAKAESTTKLKLNMNIFSHTVDNLRGTPVKLSDFKGAKAYLLVNVARK